MRSRETTSAALGALPILLFASSFAVPAQTGAADPQRLWTFDAGG